MRCVENTEAGLGWATCDCERWQTARQTTIGEHTFGSTWWDKHHSIRPSYLSNISNRASAYSHVCACHVLSWSREQQHLRNFRPAADEQLTFGEAGSLCQFRLRERSDVMEKRRRESKVHLAVVGGAFGTVGSLLGKLAGGFGVSTWGSLLVSGVFFALMIASNTVGCLCFVKALNGCETSLQPTIASTATSYICSMVAGILFFGETTSLYWWCGTSLILLGLVLICNDSSTKQDECREPANEDNENADEGKLKHQ